MTRTLQIHKQHGVTLVELMIAITIGLVLIGGLLQVYLGSKQSYNLAEAASRVQENGRFAVDTLNRDIRMADFFGCLKQPDSSQIQNNLNPSGPGYTESLHSFGDGITGTDGDGVNNSDSLSIGGAFGAGIVVEPPFMVTSSSAIQISTGNGLEQGDIVFLSDCTQGDVFQISNTDPNTSGTVVHNTGDVTEPGNYTPPDITSCPGANTHCLSKTYGMDAQIYLIRNYTYDIQTGANGRPALFQNDVEIIDNVQSMQILYGEDTDNDLNRVPNRYVTATNVSDWDNVVSVQLSLLMTSPEEILEQSTAQTFQVADQSISTSDRRLRRVFTTTATIRNRVP
jgi:type IV pilus assembly protein PilW